MTEEKKYWLDDPANVTKLVRGLWAFGILAVIAGFVIQAEGHFGFEEWPAFYAIYGFAGCVVLVTAARGLRKIIMRSEDYYDE